MKFIIFKYNIERTVLFTVNTNKVNLIYIRIMNMSSSDIVQYIYITMAPNIAMFILYFTFVYD